ncbi:MAG: hypothetical protein Tsb002_01660 [Wenzhouxiangellaceae bacterium]
MQIRLLMMAVMALCCFSTAQGGLFGGPQDSSSAGAGDILFADGFEVLPFPLFEPPDPASIAPPVDETVPGHFGDELLFLCMAENAVQRGGDCASLQPHRLAALRGRVFDDAGAPLAGVLVRVPSHPEYGYTFSRADGVYDLLVNGGGEVTLELSHPDFLRAQRRLPTRWQQYETAPDVHLAALDSAVTEIRLNDPALQVHQASQSSDVDGERRAVLLFPPGLQAWLSFADGVQTPMNTMAVRATEYTVGEKGPLRMPAALPESSGYTYAVELSADEALAADAESVVFDQPLAFYVENFLGFSSGVAVPSAYYDFSAQSWLPSTNGRIVEIITIQNSLAQVDIDGDGVADDPAALAGLGITSDELARLADLYTAGQSLWRVPITHFTPWDHNWPYGPPPEAEPPPEPETENDGDGDGSDDPPGDEDYPDPDAGNEEPGADDAGSDDGGDSEPENPETEDPSCETGSIIECENRVLGETINLPGTDFSLHYRSSRSPGGIAGYQRRLRVPLSTATVPGLLQRASVDVDWRGLRLNAAEFDSLQPYQSVTFDGAIEDRYGRVYPIQTAQMDVRLSYWYAPFYYGLREDFDNSFGLSEGVLPLGGRAAGQVALARQWSANVATRAGIPAATEFNARSQKIGGWTLSAHHVFDPRGGVLWRGDGGKRRLNELSAVAIQQVLPFGLPVGEPILDFAIAADGRVAILTDEFVNQRLLLMSADGQISELSRACLEPKAPIRGDVVVCGDDPDASNTEWAQAWSLSWGEDGELWLGMRQPFAFNASLLRFTVANGAVRHQAAPAACFEIAAIEYHGQRLYYSCVESVWMQWRDGQHTPLAGNLIAPPMPPPAAGVSALWQSLDGARDLQVDQQGNVYIAETGQHRILRIDPLGRRHVIAGAGQPGFTVDGQLALDAALDTPVSLSITADGQVIVVEQGAGRVRMIGRDGRWQTLIGGGVESNLGSALGRRWQLTQPRRLRLHPDGSVIADLNLNGQLARLSHNRFAFDPAVDGYIIPSEDGSEVYHFNRSGRHLETRYSLTNGLRYAFNYNGAGYLTEISDGDGNITTITRDDQNRASAITDPFGVATQMTMAGDDLTGLTWPDGGHWGMGYLAGVGLLTTFTDPRGHSSNYDYTGDGLLQNNTNAAGGGWQLESRRYLPRENRWITLTDSNGYRKVHWVNDAANGHQYRGRWALDLAERSVATSAFEQASINSNHLRTERALGPDPRFGLLSPNVQREWLSTPGGLQQLSEFQRQATPIQPGAGIGELDLQETLTLNGRPWQSHYNAANKVWTLTSPAGRSNQLIIDGQQRPTRFTVPGIAPIEYQYDEHGRLAQISQSDGSQTREVLLDYDADGYLTLITDAENRTVLLANDDNGRPLAQTRTDGEVIRFGYDANGNLNHVTPPGQPQHGFEHTVLNQQSAYQPPMIGLPQHDTRYAFDPERRLQSIERPDKRTVTVSHVSNTRLIDTLGLQRGLIDFDYRFQSRQLSRVSAPDNIVLDLAYDGPLLTGYSWSGAVSGQVGFAYDNDFRLSQLTIAGAPVAYQYDADGLLIQAGDLTLARDIDNGLLIGGQLGVVSDVLDYNAFGELSDYQAQANASTIFQQQFQRDKLGRISRKTEIVNGVAETFDYSYDLAGRLATVTQDGSLISTYTYDANGNRLSHATPTGTTTGAHDAQDRLLSYGPNTYQYNANGDLIIKITPQGDTRYTYDELGNLTQVTLPDGTEITYLIDGLNRRIGKKINGILVKSWLYQDPLNPVAELDGNGNITARFIYASRANMPDVIQTSAATYRLISDHLGSPRQVINAATGQIVQLMAYDEFGNVLINTNPGLTPFGFAGGLYDEHTGLVRFGARDYDAEIGRWLSKDPIRFLGGENLYGYVAGNPVNWIDPSGLDRLKFDGETIQHLNDNGEIVGTYPASSGVEGVTDPSIPWRGPIPPGEFTLNPVEISEGGFLRNLLGDWGRFRAPLHPSEGTNTFGRDNFFLHGGKEPGSAGCIDVGSNDRVLFPKLIEHEGPINVVVDY